MADLRNAFTTLRRTVSRVEPRVAAAAPLIAAGVYYYGATSTDLPVVDVGSNAPRN